MAFIYQQINASGAKSNVTPKEENERDSSPATEKNGFKANNKTERQKADKVKGA